MPLFPNKQDIARLSRDRNFLLKACLFLGIISVGLSAGLSLLISFDEEFSEKTDDPKRDGFSEILELIRNPLLGHTHHSATDSRFLRSGDEPSETEGSGESEASSSPLKIITESKKLNKTGRILLTQLHSGLSSDNNRPQAIQELSKLPKDTRYRNEFIGDIYSVSNEKEKALTHYLAEGKAFPKARYSQRSALLELWRMDDYDQIRSLLQTPGFRDALRAGELLPILTDARDFPGLLRAIFQQSMSQLRFPGLIPPLFTALLWALILLSFTRLSRRIIILSLIAFLLGMMSTSLTLFVVMIQDRIQGFTEGGETPIAQLIFWVAGVGLREETAKLLCFIPIAIWIRPRKNNLEALILAGMVGLGFACEENFSYFASGSGAGVVWSRFLTANALHFSLTGVAGFFFFRMLVRKGWGMEDFLLNFLIVVLAHGLYDALLSMPSLKSYSPLGIIALALIAYRYFDQLREHINIEGLHQRVSPLGVFVLGSATLLFSTLVFSSGLMPFTQALGVFAMSIGSMMTLAFAFISRFRDL